MKKTSLILIVLVITAAVLSGCNVTGVTPDEPFGFFEGLMMGFFWPLFLCAIMDSVRGFSAAWGFGVAVGLTFSLGGIVTMFAGRVR